MMAHTYVVLEVSPAAYSEIQRKLEDAGYGHVFQEEYAGHPLIDMHGIALGRRDDERRMVINKDPSFEVDLTRCSVCGEKGGEISSQEDSARIYVCPRGHEWSFPLASFD